jgi:hypothetical protein
LSVSTVITLGYGTFGSVNFLPTIGYSSSGHKVVVIDTHDGEGERGRKKRERDQRRKDFLRRAFDGGDGPEELVEIVRPFAKATPERIEIDWKALREDVRAIARIAELQRQQEIAAAQEDDDETFFML